MPRSAIVIANGTLPRESIVRDEIARVEFVLAADGGANQLHKLGIVPDAILGDMDSLTTPVPDGVELIPAPDQDRTDLDKAVAYLVDAGFDPITIIGATGDRLDHTFGALAIVARCGVRLVDDVGIALRIQGPGDIVIAASPGRTVSLLPCGVVCGLTTANLKWNLHRADFSFGEQDGTSNVATGDRIEVSVRKGTVIVYLHHVAGAAP